MGYTEDRAYWVARLSWAADDTNYSLTDLQNACFAGVGMTKPVTTVTKPNVVGIRASNTALANLLTALVNKGLITDATTAT